MPQKWLLGADSGGVTVKTHLCTVYFSTTNAYFCARISVTQPRLFPW